MRARQGGFTLVELVLTLVITGILVSVAGPRFFDRQVFDQRLFYEETLAAVRYGQKYALASGCQVRLTLNDAGYVLNRAESCNSGSFACGAACDVPSPSGDSSFTGSKPSGVTLAPNPFVVRFGSLGQSLGGDTGVDVGGFRMNIHGATGFVEAVR